MDIKNLQYFIAVAEYLNFSKAAQNLYISQPSLSIRISALEEELGTELFHRTHQQVYLTNAGAALLPVAKDIIEKINSLPFVVEGAQRVSVTAQKLRIGIDTTEDRNNISVISNAFSSFQQDYPSIEMEVSDVTYEQYEQKLLSNSADFCLIVLQEGAKLNPLFLSIPLLTEPTVLVTADAEGKSLEELLRTREIQLLFEGERGLRWNNQYLSFLSSILPEVHPTYLENTAALCMNLLYGGTITFLPLTYAQTLDTTRLSIYPIDMPHCQITYTLIWNKLNMNPAIQLMINEVRKVDTSGDA